MSEEHDPVQWIVSEGGDQIPLPPTPPTEFTKDWANTIAQLVAQESADKVWYGDAEWLSQVLQAVINRAISDAVLKIERFIVKEVV